MTESIVTPEATETPDTQILAVPFLPLKTHLCTISASISAQFRPPVVLWEARPPSSGRMEGDVWEGVGLLAHEHRQVTLGQNKASSLGWRLD